MLTVKLFVPPFFDDISPYNYEVLQLVISKWRQICEAAIPEELDTQMEQLLSAGFQEIEKTESILNFLVGYKVVGFVPKTSTQMHQLT